MSAQATTQRDPARKGWAFFICTHETESTFDGNVPCRNPRRGRCRHLKCNPTPNPAPFIGPRRSGPTRGHSAALHPRAFILLWPGGFGGVSPGACAPISHWHKLPGAPPRPSGWPGAGKRHTTPPGCPARPRRAPALCTWGAGGLACQPSGCAALCCSIWGPLAAPPGSPGRVGWCWRGPPARWASAKGPCMIVGLLLSAGL